MATTVIEAFYLGTFADLDPNESNWQSENSGTLLGSVFGTAGAPLHASIDSLTLNDVNSDGTISENDNGQSADSLIYQGTSSALDGVIDYSVTLTYIDGTTTTTQMEILQDVSGRLFLIPYREGNVHNDVLNDKPIQSIELNSIVGDTFSGLFANAEQDAFIDGSVDGTAGSDNITENFTDAEGTQNNAYGGDDTIFGYGGDDTIQGGAGADSMDGGDGADTFIIQDGFGSDTIVGGEGGTDDDTIDFSGLTGPVTVAYSGDESGTISDGTDTLSFSEIENLNGTYTIDGVTDVLFDGNANLAPQTGTVQHAGLTNQFDLDGNATDSVGTNNGTVVGATTVAGRDGSALSFDEVNDYVEIPDVTMNNEFTVSFQFKLDDNTGSLFQYMYSHGDINAANSLNVFITEASHGTDPNVLRTVIRDSNDGLDNAALQFDISGIVGDGQWHTYTLTVENGVGSKVYLDGVIQNSDATGGDAFNPSGNLFLGARQDLDPDRMFGGELDTVQIYSRPLAPGEITALHDTDGPYLEAGTVVASVSDVVDADYASGHTFALTDDAGGKFAIDPNTGAISLTDVHDATTVYSDTVTVQVTDPDLATFATTLGVVIGTEGSSDVLTAADTQNVMYGLGGDDNITGGTGDDAIYGGTGNDTIVAQSGNDIIDGGAGNDSIDGGLGNDSITGGTGNDSLTGGDGDDVFVYQVGDGDDTITDFNSGNTGTLSDGNNTNNDFIDLSGYYDNLSELYADQADDGILNQSNTTDTKGNSTDYSNNTQFGSGSLTFTGATADNTTFTEENTGVVCFTTGTAILTPRGDVLIEDLRVGDLVVTADNGPQRIRWIGLRHLDCETLKSAPNLRPVLFNARVLQNERPLLVSPQHCMMIGDDGLARAKHLAETMRGVRVAHGKREVTYVHLMFDQHQIIFAERAASESFYPGPMSLTMIDNRARAELVSILQGLPSHADDRNHVVQKYGETARPILAKRALGDILEMSSGPAIRHRQYNPQGQHDLSC